jgi:hypothetical protein
MKAVLLFTNLATRQQPTCGEAMSNQCLDAAIATLKEAGVYDCQLSRGGKHLQIHWAANGALRFYVLAGTPGDWRSVHNTKAEVRRMLKADGLLVGEPASAPKPRRLSLEQRVQRLEQLVALAEKLALSPSSR